MSLWSTYPLLLPSLIVGVTIVLWATSLLPEFITALLFFTAAMTAKIAPPEVIFGGFASSVTENELVQRSPFMMLAEELPEARDHMGRFALAMAQQSDGSFVLLATERNLLMLNRASAEELQDHQCAILN